MDWLVWFFLLGTCLKVTGSREKDESCLLQPKVIWRKAGQNVVLKCSQNCSAKGLMHYEWFTSMEKVHLCLNLSSNSHKYSLEGASLKIKSLQGNDSGIYYCAAVSSGNPGPGAQHVGLGTTLEVRVQIKPMVRIILWLLFVILAIYSLALVTLMIKKYGCNMSDPRRMCKTDKKISNKKAQFRDVLQEMYNRRPLDKGKKNMTRKRSQAEAANTEFNHSADDIYQNV